MLTLWFKNLKGIGLCIKRVVICLNHNVVYMNLYVVRTNRDAIYR